MKTSSAKAKGRRLQDWVANKIATLLNSSFGHEDNIEIEQRLMGQKGVDVILRGKALKKFPYSIECKNTERWGVQKDIEQAIRNTREGTDWLLFYKKNRSKPIVIMDAEIFFKILKGREIK